MIGFAINDINADPVISGLVNCLNCCLVDCNVQAFECLLRLLCDNEITCV